MYINRSSCPYWNWKYQCLEPVATDEVLSGGSGATGKSRPGREVWDPSRHASPEPVVRPPVFSSGRGVLEGP